MSITDLPASAFAGCGRLIVPGGYWICGNVAKSGAALLCKACRSERRSSPDTTLVKSSRPATCAVCREVVTGSIELPTGEHVCGACACIALRNMIDDAKGRTDR